MYTPGFLARPVVFRLGSTKEGGVLELGGIPDEGLIERSNPETGMRAGPEGLVRKTQMMGAPEGGKRR